jgi:cytochrome c biogenesis protein CcmG/thiol:disulfide interchange protein DsbE
MPGLAELARPSGPKGLAVVGVSLDKDDHRVVQAFVDHFKLPYPVAFPAALSQVDQGMQGIPTTILVDRAGRVVKTYVGAVRRGDFEADVRDALAETVGAR